MICQEKIFKPSSKPLTDVSFLILESNLLKCWTATYRKHCITLKPTHLGILKRRLTKGINAKKKKKKKRKEKKKIQHSYSTSENDKLLCIHKYISPTGLSTLFNK